MSELSFASRIRGGVLGAVAADALGVPVEFSSREERRRDPVTGVRGYGTYHQPPGSWSDDSSMLLCTVEALCGEYDAEALGRLFTAWCFEGACTPWGETFDRGGTTAAALRRVRDGVPAEQAGLDDERSNGNGSLMRILPVALRWAEASEVMLLDRTHCISAITHRHPRSQMACGIYCLIAREMLRGQDAEKAYHAGIAAAKAWYQAEPFVREHRHFERVFSGEIGKLPEEEIHSGGYVIDTLDASLWCLLTTDSYAAAVLQAINLGGDTDTTACVTGGLAGLRYGEEAIPTEWVSALARREMIEHLIDRFIDAVRGML
ncbi:MAG: ADP-ribosylglycohydrolase family protein [Armatimonadota bacterium]